MFLTERFNVLLEYYEHAVLGKFVIEETQDYKLFSKRAEQQLFDLLHRYTEPHRRYHTIRHIVDCIDMYANLAVDFDYDILLAIWYHDAVYDPRAKHGKNEEDSAVLMINHHLNGGQFGIPIERLEKVRDLIMDTASHKNKTILTDVDLSILGSDSERYLEYARQIRQEYWFVPEKEFCEARSRILSNFLSEPIYGTKIFEPFESKARHNLQSEIEHLKANLELMP